MLEHAAWGRVGQAQATFTQRGREGVGLGVESGCRMVIQEPTGAQIGGHPLQRVMLPPVGQLLGVAVPGRIVSGGVGTHPVGHRFHQRRASLAGRLQRPAGYRERRQHVVAVHLDPLNTET